MLIQDPVQNVFYTHLYTLYCIPSFLLGGVFINVHLIFYLVHFKILRKKNNAANKSKNEHLYWLLGTFYINLFVILLKKKKA